MSDPKPTVISPTRLFDILAYPGSEAMASVATAVKESLTNLARDGSIPMGFGDPRVEPSDKIGVYTIRVPCTEYCARIMEQVLGWTRTTAGGTVWVSPPDTTQPALLPINSEALMRAEDRAFFEMIGAALADGVYEGTVAYRGLSERKDQGDVTEEK